MTNDSTNILKRAFLEAEVKQLAVYDSLPEVSGDCSPGFEKHMNRLIINRRKPYWKYMNSVAKRTVAVLVALLLLFSMSMSISAIREPVIEFMVNIYETFTGFFVGDNHAGVPDTIEKVYLITELPDGYVLNNQSKNKLNIQTIWTDGENSIVFSQTTLNNSEVRIDTESNEYRTATVNNTTVYYVEKNGTRIVLWLTSEYSFSMVCPDELDWATTEKMIKSME